MPRDVAHPGQQVLESRRVARLLAGMPQDLPEPFDARMLLAVQQAVGPWDGTERRRGHHGPVSLPSGAGGSAWPAMMDEPLRRRPHPAHWLLVAGGFPAGVAVMAAAGFRRG